MTDALPQYPATELPTDPVAKSVSRESAFSKPGQSKGASKSTGKASKGWAPAKGTRFRSLTGKQKGRKRKTTPDPRRVTFY